MKSEPLKATITKGTPSLKNDGVLHLVFTGDYLKKLKEYIYYKEFAPGSAVEVTIDNVNTSKTVQQVRTFHLLIDIYYKSGLPSDNNKQSLKNRIKYENGVTEFYETSDGKVMATLKSISEYTLKEGRILIDGLISEMLLMGCNDKRFQNMILEWNTFKQNK